MGPAASPPFRRNAWPFDCCRMARTRICFLPRARTVAGAVYTDSGHMIHIIRKVIVRINAKLNWLILKLH